MRPLWRLWFGLGALWVGLVYGWTRLISADQDAAWLIYPIGIGPVALIGAVLLVCAWAFRR